MTEWIPPKEVAEYFEKRTKEALQYKPGGLSCTFRFAQDGRIVDNWRYEEFSQPSKDRN
jgi:hypothetical protein